MFHANAWTPTQVILSEFLTKSQNYDVVLARLKADGIVRIHSADMDQNDFLEFTKFFGTSITLPDFLTTSKCQDYPEIIEVINFSRNSDDLNRLPSFGNYWHYEGDFWDAGQHRVISFLYSQLPATSGGETAFLDTQRAFAALPDDVRDTLVDLAITVDPKNIEDFRGISSEDLHFFSDLPVEHRVIQNDAESNVKSLYIPYFEGTIGTTVKYTYPELMAFVDKPEFKYLHQWESDDMLVWDNTKFMHRAMGETVGKRLLWRTQARLM